MIVGRVAEKQKLKKLFDSPRSEFAIVFGRRRVGKTFLVREYFKGRFSFHVTGLANADKTLQLHNFHNALQQHGKTGEEPPADWLEAFQELQQILEKDRKKKKVVFIDELPWMDGPRSGFLPAFEHFWNHWASARKDILLIACGSAASWMIGNLLNNRGGLHNRVTQRLKISPFNLGECEAFIKKKGLALSRYQILEIYMAFGGVPFYWEALEKGQSAAQNIDRLCFGKNALFQNEFENLYASLFRKSERHTAIVRALSRKTKGLTRSEISRQTKIPSGGTFSKTLQELEESGFLRIYTPFQKKTRDSLYQLTDPFSFFHLQFMENAKGRSGHWLSGIDSPKQRAWAGFAFERACFKHVAQIKKALGIGGVQTSISSWRSSGQEGGAQINLLIERRDQVINICEMKFSIHPFSITKKYAEELRRKLGVFIQETKTRKAVFLTLVSTYGLAENQHSLGLVQNVVEMEALFESGVD